MGLVDLDNFIESLMWMWDNYKDNPLFKNPIFNDIKLALDKQGLEYKDGEIVKTQRRVSAEAKENGYGESEEERIRKSLIHLVHLYGGEFGMIDANTSVEKAIAWLEKQGEQKPVDKVGTKFKVGDWVVSDCNNVAYIESISETKYILQCKDGYHEKMSIEYIDRCWHLWTIQDAKDGDILSNGKMTVIFKHFEEPSYRQRIVAYIGLDNGGDIQITDDTWTLGIDKAKPATKEQCDLLFQKMHEAGYEFDFTTKELKKIEQKTVEEVNGEDYGIDGLWHAQRILEKTLGEVEGYQTDDGILSHKCAITAVKKLYEQKPTEWSEEDAMQLDAAINIVANSGHTGTSDWLKSLKDRYTWKPCEEQLQILHWIANVKLGESIVEQEASKHLNELYNDLKKL